MCVILWLIKHHLHAILHIGILYYDTLYMDCCSWYRCHGDKPSKMAAAPTTPGCGRDRLFHTLEKLWIPTMTKEYDTDANLVTDTQGTYCKNLLLKDRKGQFYLVIIRIDQNIDLKSLKQLVKAHRNFSFATPQEMKQLMNVEANGVTPFGILFDDESKVRIIIDKSLTSVAGLYFHPFDERAATLISFSELERFVMRCKHNMEVYDLSAMLTSASPPGGGEWKHGSSVLSESNFWKHASSAKLISNFNVLSELDWIVDSCQIM